MKPQKIMPKWAFPAIERPSFTDELRFPEDLTQLSSVALGKFHGQFTSMLAYANSVLAEAVVEKLRVESTISKEFNRRVVALSVQDVQKWKINNIVESSLVMLDLKDKLLDCNVRIETVRTYRENYEKYAGALSREMSRRTGEQKSYGA